MARERLKDYYPQNPIHRHPPEIEGGWSTIHSSRYVATLPPFRNLPPRAVYQCKDDERHQIIVDLTDKQYENILREQDTYLAVQGDRK